MSISQPNEFELWSPIAAALDLYQRRAINEPEAVFEHVWRLIHVNEATVVLLGSALSSRLLSLADSDLPNGLLRELERRLVGGGPEDKTVGCLVNGSIAVWLDLFSWFAKSKTDYECGFLAEMRNYLSDDLDGDLAFVNGWSKIDPKPFTERRSRTERFRCLNHLRNKLAHVPIPYDCLDELHRGLREETYRAVFCRSNSYSSFVVDDAELTEYSNCHPVLLGKLQMASGHYLTGRRFIQGNTPARSTQGATRTNSNDVFFVTAGQSAPVTWSGNPFLRIDKNFKSSLLFRAPELAISDGEQQFHYHRYDAEVNPVSIITVSADVVLQLKPSASRDVHPIEESAEISDQDVDTQGKVSSQQTIDPHTSKEAERYRFAADQHFKNRELREAVKCYAKLSTIGDPGYYNYAAKMQFGRALAILVPELTERERNLAPSMLRMAASLFRDVAENDEPKFKSRAYYMRSRANHALFRELAKKPKSRRELERVYDKVQADMQAAKESEIDAADDVHSAALDSWQAYLDNQKEIDQDILGKAES